jgi:hypothetical protein
LSKLDLRRIRALKECGFKLRIAGPTAAQRSAQLRLQEAGTPFAIGRFQEKPMHALGAAMPFATTESTARPNSPSLSELIRFIHRQTQQQVRELAIHQRENRLVVTGRTATYYAKQLVTQAILTAAPAVQLVNEISVG